MGITKARAEEAVTAKDAEVPDDEQGGLLCFIDTLPDDNSWPLSADRLGPGNSNKFIVGYLRKAQGMTSTPAASVAGAGVSAATVAGAGVAGRGSSMRRIESLLHRLMRTAVSTSEGLRSLQRDIRDSQLQQLEPAQSMSSTSSRISKLRSQAGSHYATITASGSVFCMMSGGSFDAQAVKAAHILSRSMPLWVWGKDSDLCDSELNIMFLHSNLERHFDRMRLTVIPGANNSFKVYVLDPELRNKAEPYATGHKDGSVNPGGRCDKHQQPIYYFKDLHGGELHFRNDARPAKRLLAMHAMVALNVAKRKGWLDQLDQPLEVTAAAWGSPTCDPYIRNKFFCDQASLVETGSFESLGSIGNVGNSVEQQGEQQDTDSLGIGDSDSDT